MGLQAALARFDPDISVIHVSGELTSENSGALAPLVQGRLDRGEKKIILDLAGVERIDSLGGTSLVRCFFAAREVGARLCVAGARHGVAQLFQATGVDTLIHFFPTTTRAAEFLGASTNAI